MLSVRSSAELDEGEVVHDWVKPETGNSAPSPDMDEAGVTTSVDCTEAGVDAEEALVEVLTAALSGAACEADADATAAATDL